MEATTNRFGAVMILIFMLSFSILYFPVILLMDAVVRLGAHRRWTGLGPIVRAFWADIKEAYTLDIGPLFRDALRVLWTGERPVDHVQN